MMRYSRLHTYLLFLLILFLLISNSAMAEESWIDRLQEKSQFAGFKSEDYHKCGFPLVLEAMMSEDVSRQAIVSQHHLELMQQTYDTYLSPSGHFLIHYETSGFDAIPDYDRNENGTPDYLEFVAKSFDRAWEIEIDSLGFDPPPDQNGNPVQTYSVFCSRLNQYGITFWNSGDDLPDPGFNYPSRIEISTNYAFVPDTLYAHITNDPIVKDSLAIAVTAAHEFNHAIQLGYRIWFDNNNPNGPVSDLWFIENSAVYMEEVVAEEVDDYYQYLPSFFNHTDKHIAITFPELRIFGEVVLDIMLGQLYGKTITREVWTEIRNRPALQALDRVLIQKGSDFDTELQRLASWMFYSGPNAIGDNFFPEGADYPTPKTIDISTGQVDPAKQRYSGELPPLSFQYLTATMPSGGQSFFLAPNENPEFWSGTYFGFSPPYIFNFASNTFTKVDPSATNFQMKFIVFSGNWNTGNVNSTTEYEIQLQITNTEFENKVIVAPNIIKPERGILTISFTNLPPEARIEIFSSNGLHLNTLHPNSSGLTASWDLRTFDNKLVGSGVYIYRVISPSHSESGKIMVVR